MAPHQQEDEEIKISQQESTVISRAMRCKNWINNNKLPILLIIDFLLLYISITIVPILIFASTEGAHPDSVRAAFAIYTLTVLSVGYTIYGYFNWKFAWIFIKYAMTRAIAAQLISLTMIVLISVSISFFVYPI